MAKNEDRQDRGDMDEERSIADRIIAESGPNKAPDVVERLLRTHRLHLVDTGAGKRLIDGAEYHLNLQIVNAITNRTGPIATGATGQETTEFLAGTEIASDPSQVAAFHGAIGNRTSIIEGPPGTGKSTVASVVSQWVRRNEPGRVVVAAFSARIADKTAKRCKAAGYTLHQLTQTVPGEEHISSGRAIDDEITTIIVDEAFSMGATLLQRLLRMAPSTCRIVMVGDPRQLPPIERGRALHDLLDCEVVPTFRLSKSHRMGDGSHLALQAGRIAEGLMPRQGEGLRIRTTSERGADSDHAKAMMAARLYKASKANGRTAVVITPNQYGRAGHVAINRLIAGDDGVSAGDELITTEPRRGKWKNGEMATVVERNADGITLAFQDGRRVTVGHEENSFVLAYAISGHRGQGLEFDRGILVLAESGRKMITREFLVAAFSRARDMVVLTDPGLIEAGIRRHEIGTRNPVIPSIVSQIRARLAN